MKIYFCDLCNESVPQGDLEGGRAVMRHGRVICSACEHAMSHGNEGDAAEAGPPAAGEKAETAFTPARKLQDAPRGGSPAAGLGVGIASLALLFAVAASAFLFTHTDERLRTLESDVSRARREAVSDARAIESRIGDDLSQTGEGLAQVREALADMRARMEESARAQSDSVELVREELASWNRRWRELEGLTLSVERSEREVEQVKELLASLRSELLRVGDRIEDVRAAELVMAEAPPPVPTEDAKPEWWPLLAELASQNSGVRWQAVQSLGATRDPAVAEHLTAMLKDPDIFVRMATARILGDLGAVIGIPALIDALEDPEASVREASIVSLRGITGQNFRFEPSGKEAERAKRVKAWRDWWEKASKDLLGG